MENILGQALTTIGLPITLWALHEGAKHLGAYGPKTEARKLKIKTTAKLLAVLSGGLLAWSNGTLEGDHLMQFVEAAIFIAASWGGPEMYHRLKKNKEEK